MGGFLEIADGRDVCTKRFRINRMCKLHQILKYKVASFSLIFKRLDGFRANLICDFNFIELTSIVKRLYDGKFYDTNKMSRERKKVGNKIFIEKYKKK